MSKQRHIKIQGHLSERQIRDYMQNKLGRAEKHQVEDHLLDCGFCSDAIDGFQKFPQAKVVSHKDLLSSGSQGNSGFPWVKIAAAVALIVSLVAGYWSVLQLSDDQQTNISSNEPVESLQEKNKEDELGITSNADAAAEEHSEEEDLSRKSPSETSQVQMLDKKRTRSEIGSDELESTDRIIALKPEEEKSKVETVEIDAIEDAVFSESLASARALESPAPVHEPSMTSGQPAGVGFIDGNNLKEEAILQDEKSISSSSKYRKSKKQSSRQSALNEMNAENLSPSFSIAPQGGWPAFKQYLEQNINHDLASEVSGTEKKVAVRITMKAKDGQPELEVVKGLCELCNKEALRLIKEGPKWNIINDSTHIGPNTAIVEVNFNLD